MHKIFQQMNDARFAPNNITFNVMIDLYAKAGMLDRAHNALKLAQQQGPADKISFSTLMNAYGKRQDFAKMEETLWEMQNAGSLFYWVLRTPKVAVASTGDELVDPKQGFTLGKGQIRDSNRPMLLAAAKQHNAFVKSLTWVSHVIVRQL